MVADRAKHLLYEEFSTAKALLLTHARTLFPLYETQSIDLHCKPFDLFLHGGITDQRGNLQSDREIYLTSIIFSKRLDENSY